MTRLFFVVLALTLALTGCGGGPGDKVVKTGLEKKLYAAVMQEYEMQKLLSGWGGNKNIGETPTQEDIKIDYLNTESHQKLDNGDYTLKATFDFENKKNGKKSEKISVRLTMSEVDGEWKIVKEEAIN